MLILYLVKNKPKGPNGLYLELLGDSLRSQVQVIKHLGGAAQVREEVGGLWCSPAASGLTISSGQVGSQPQVKLLEDGDH